jgi:hypothetical protein
VTTDEREGEGAHLVARHRRVDGHDAARDLLLHEGVGILAELRVPEGVVAQLESPLGEELHLPEAPLVLLPVDSLVAEERSARLGAGEQAHDGLVAPVRLRLREVEPDPDHARRVDLELPVPLDVAELRRRRVVEREDDGAEPARQIELPVEELGHRHRAVPALVEQLEVPAESAALALPARLLVADEVVLEDHHAPELVRRPRGRGGVGRGAAGREVAGREVGGEGAAHRVGGGRVRGAGGRVGRGVRDVGATGAGGECEGGEERERGTAGRHEGGAARAASAARGRRRRADGARCEGEARA